MLLNLVFIMSTHATFPLQDTGWKAARIKKGTFFPLVFTANVGQKFLTDFFFTVPTLKVYIFTYDFNLSLENILWTKNLIAHGFCIQATVSNLRGGYKPCFIYEETSTRSHTYKVSISYKTQLHCWQFRKDNELY